jgi:phosphonate degradation associated HDIG domain protein
MSTPETAIATRTPRDIVEEVMALLRQSGTEGYFGEAINKLAHAEQCAAQAARAGADEELILAALLHDIGHLLDTPGTQRDPRVGVINHDEIGEQWLRERGFSARVAALVGGHVDAKRYLTAVNPQYRARLSSASVETLALQGGPMDDTAAAEFAAVPELRDILRLRSWDEMAKDPAWQGPDLESYREMMIRHLTAQRPQ